ncbi:hypothetical protein H8959_016055 [Pygathrix nigripes]
MVRKHATRCVFVIDGTIESVPLASTYGWVGRAHLKGSDRSGAEGPGDRVGENSRYVMQYTRHCADGDDSGEEIQTLTLCGFRLDREQLARKGCGSRCRKAT